ncbi:MAG: GTPase Era [Chloroflexota bacterium]
MNSIDEYESILLPDQEALHPDHRSGFVAVIGRPNVGKSTLLNQILEQKIAITSPKPQTTRDQLLGIYTSEIAQMILLDTPGIHKPQHKLGEYMMSVVRETVSDADILLWLVDVNSMPKKGDRYIAELLEEIHLYRPIRRLVLGLNKIDRWDEDKRKETLSERRAEYEELLDWLPDEAKSTIQFSALTGQGAAELVEHVRSQLPLGPQYYPPDQVTDLQLRFITEEIIREKALELLEQEVPHSIAVVIDEFVERDHNDEDLTYISATIYVERESQKGIVLGKKGTMIKQIGQLARPDVEDLVETKVYLELWVKVWEKWRKKSGMLRRLGYAPNL